MDENSGGGVERTGYKDSGLCLEDESHGGYIQMILLAGTYISKFDQKNRSSNHNQNGRHRSLGLINAYKLSIGVMSQLEKREDQLDII